MGKRLLAILIAAVIALVGAVLVFLYARTADQRAIERQTPTTVYVAEQLIPAGTALKDAVNQELLVKTDVASAAKPAGALTAVDSTNQDLLALADIAPGTYVISASFGTTPLGTKAIQVPNGMVALSIELTDPARVGQFVTPGSRIAIYATYQLKRLDTSEEATQFNDLDIKGTSVLLEDVMVIGMGNTSLTPAQTSTDDGQQQQQQASFLVTVAVTPEQSVRLVHAISQYTLYAGLRGDEVTITPPATVDDRTIFGAVQ